MTLTRNTLRAAFIAVVSVIVTAAEPQPAPQNLSAQFSDAYVFGAHLLHNVRDGYRKFEDANQYQHVPCDNFFMFAFAAGKRFALENPRLRIQGVLEFAWGEASGEEYYVELIAGGHIPATIYSNYITNSLLTEVHWLIPSFMRTYYLSAGAGLHITTFRDILKASWNKETLITGTTHLTFSPGINIGAGMEYKTGSNRAISLSYNMRLMMAAKFIETGRPAGQPVFGIMFPMGAEYTEFFYTHALQVQFLLQKRKKTPDY
jgi:hypothetical protein